MKNNLVFVMQGLNRIIKKKSIVHYLLVNTAHSMLSLSDKSKVQSILSLTLLTKQYI